MIQFKKVYLKTQNILFMKEAYHRLIQRSDLGFFQLPDRNELWSDAQEVGQKLRQKYDHLVVVGIGGSSLGARALVELFQTPKNHNKIYFLDNVDPIEFERLLQSVGNLQKTAWLVISKSGGTIETVVAADFVRQHYEQLEISFYDKVHVVSENRDNALTTWARAHQIPQSEIPIDVGGRFSVLTPGGMIVAAYLGVNIHDMRSGAALAVKDSEGIAEMSAQIQESFQNEKWVTVLWTYTSTLRFFGLWWQQLWAESLAKKVTRKGGAAPRVSTPISGVGACDQHSILQQVMEGAKDKFVLFIVNTGFGKEGHALKTTEFPSANYIVGHRMGDLLNAEASATENALEQSDVMTSTIEIPDIEPKTIGYLFMFWQMVIGTLGEALDINAFDQPGVELGKRLARSKFTTK
ncbi:MAG: glucose-6-phosphate isomerase [Oligoflexia bacterium]|nr:MAG: glucose-6-phosphate isomerase [Oligoflexia bacterium]